MPHTVLIYRQSTTAPGGAVVLLNALTEYIDPGGSLIYCSFDFLMVL